MNKLTAENVLKIVREEKVDFIRLQFVDILGMMKNIAITANELEKALNNQMMFDGSSIAGFVRIEESDMYLRPDPSTFVLLPWFQDYKIARMICDIYNPDGTPFCGDPRHVLRSAIKEAEEMGYDFFVGPECEFFLFQTDAEGKATTKTHDEASYFDLAPIDNGEIARIDMVKTLMDMGFQIEASHHENAPGQHEIDFKYGDALSSADKIITFKLVVKVMAKKNKLHATFMPKPLNNECGSGMHCNMSLFKDGKNAFYDPSDVNGLSKEAYYFIGGLLKHAKGMAALTNPTVNSYKRLVSGYEAPVYIAWSTANRSPLIRIPVARGTGTRIEMRNPDPSCNPYLAIAAMLAAGLEGIKNKIEPPEAIDENIYDLTDEELARLNIESLPKNLDEAVNALLKDELVKNALGAHVTDNYVKAKRIEWDKYTNYVHPWEINRYIQMY
ncbi:MAG: type I glutamate--ammonia ligase [Clostridiales bacterium]|jgi:glutamine synthetase|nr:type I glutamate--ammonia ligase [Clostridiales bacterium]